MRYGRSKAAFVIAVTGFLSGVVRWLGWLVFLFCVASKMEAQVNPHPGWYVQQIRTKDSVGIDEAIPMIGQYQPPRIYAKWLAEIVACEGLPFPTREQLEGLTFWEVNASDFQVNDDTRHTAVGVSDPPAGRMYVSIAFIWSEETIKHEFLHFLLRWTFGMAYQGGHPLEYYAKCGMHPY